MLSLLRQGGRTGLVRGLALRGIPGVRHMPSSVICLESPRRERMRMAKARKNMRAHGRHFIPFCLCTISLAYAYLTSACLVRSDKE